MNPEDRTRIAAYYDAFLPHLQQDHILNNQRLTRVKVRLSSIVKSGESILDLGCGTGLTSKFMAQLGAKVTAMDISPKLIEFARKESAHKNVKYAIGDITELYPLSPLHLKDQFDGIVMVDVFEHIPRQDIDKLLLNIERYSHDHTWIFLNIPDGRYQEAAHHYIKDHLQVIDEGYLISILLKYFNQIDFEAVDIDIYGVDTPCQYNSFLFRRDMKENLKRFMESITQEPAQNGRHYRE